VARTGAAPTPCLNCKSGCLEIAQPSPRPRKLLLDDPAAGVHKADGVDILLLHRSLLPARRGPFLLIDTTWTWWCSASPAGAISVLVYVVLLSKASTEAIAASPLLRAVYPRREPRGLSSSRRTSLLLLCRVSRLSDVACRTGRGRALLAVLCRERRRNSNPEIDILICVRAASQARSRWERESAFLGPKRERSRRIGGVTQSVKHLPLSHRAENVPPWRGPEPWTLWSRIRALPGPRNAGSSPRVVVLLRAADASDRRGAVGRQSQAAAARLSRTEGLGADHRVQELLPPLGRLLLKNG